MANRRKLSDRDIEIIIELFNTHKCTRKQLAGRFGVSLHTIDNILKANGATMRLQRPHIKFAPEDDLELIRLYRAGTPIAHIARIMDRSASSVYNRALALGIHSIKGSNSNQGGYVSDSDALKKMSDAIQPEDIVEIRANIKVGDVIKVRTVKAITDTSGIGYTTTGVIRDARVISVDNPHFCLLKLVGSGLIESKLWVDMVIEKRSSEQCREVVV